MLHSFLFASYILIVANANEIQHVFKRNEGFDDRVCAINDRVSENIAVSKIECGKICSGSTECSSYFYSDSTNECVTCKDMTMSNMLTAIGMLHYERVYTCLEILRDGYTSNGVYTLTTPVTNTPIHAYCDMTTEGGGWITWQRRFDGALRFDRKFAHYEAGFGDPHGEYWLGLKHLQEFCHVKPCEVYIHFVDFDGNSAHEWYKVFNLTASPDYILEVEQFISASYARVVDGFRKANGNNFSASDHNYRDCVSTRGWGAFWYNDCNPVNPNGKYGYKGAKGHKYIFNYSWQLTKAMKETALLIRERV